MKVEQIYTGCLAQGAYYIESRGEVALIDPLREVKPYINRAKLDDAKIKYIFETHFHADFVSGHVTLSKETGAPIIYGPNANPSFDAIIAEDGQEFKLGEITIKVLHTPGHVGSTKVSFTYQNVDDALLVKEKLQSLGYPSIDSKNGLGNKAKSFIGRATGRFS